MRVEFAEGTDGRMAGGFTQIPNVILRDGTLSERARLVYGVLLSYAWGEQSPDDGLTGLGKILGLKPGSEKSTRRALIELEKRSLVKVVRRGLGLANTYVLQPATWVKLTDRIGSNDPIRQGQMTLSDRANQPDHSFSKDNYKTTPKGEATLRTRTTQPLPPTRKRVQKKAPAAPPNTTPTDQPKPVEVKNPPTKSENPQSNEGNPPTTAPEATPAPEKKPTWEGLQYPKLLKICPEIKGSEGFPLLKTMVKRYFRHNTEAALDVLVAQGDEIGVGMIWACLQAECKRQATKNVVTRTGKAAAPVSEGNARGVDSYLRNPPKDPA